MKNENEYKKESKKYIRRAFCIVAVIVLIMLAMGNIMRKSHIVVTIIFVISSGVLVGYSLYAAKKLSKYRNDPTNIEGSHYEENKGNKKYWDRHILEVIKAVCKLEVKEEVPNWARYRLFWRICELISIIMYITFFVSAIIRKVKFQWLSGIPLAICGGFIIGFLLWLISLYVIIFSQRIKAGKYISVVIIMTVVVNIICNACHLLINGRERLIVSIMIGVCSCILFKIINVISLKLKKN
ncbi:MAG: hypothetical protein PHX70_00725 [Clostridium sp.]|nr:hypothetical protein [Clostridium sp.]